MVREVAGLLREHEIEFADVMVGSRFAQHESGDRVVKIGRRNPRDPYKIDAIENVVLRIRWSAGQVAVQLEDA